MVDHQTSLRNFSFEELLRHLDETYREIYKKNISLELDIAKLRNKPIPDDDAESVPEENIKVQVQTGTHGRGIAVLVDNNINSSLPAGQLSATELILDRLVRHCDRLEELLVSMPTSKQSDCLCRCTPRKDRKKIHEHTDTRGHLTSSDTSLRSCDDGNLDVKTTTTEGAETNAHEEVSGRFSIPWGHASTIFHIRSKRISFIAALTCFEQRPTLRAIVDSANFQVTSAVAILCYAAVIGIEAELVSRHGSSAEPSFFLWILNSCFNGYFILEFAMRIAADGRFFFLGKERRWNCLDAFVVAFSSVDVLVQMFGGDIFQTSIVAGRILKMVRLVRILRTMRAIRGMQSLAGVQKMVLSIVTSMKTLLCSVIILLFEMYFFAIIFVYAAMDASTSERTPDLDEYWGSLSKSFYSLFISVSGGQSWYYVMKPLSCIHPFYTVVFLIYIVVTVLGVMNVMTSVFVESAVRGAQQHRDLIVQETEEKKLLAVRHMREVFKQIDEDGSGLISSSEMQNFLQEESLRKYLEALDITTEDTRMLFALIDGNDSKEIDMDAFCDGCLKLKGEARSFDVHVLMYQMKRFLSKWSDFTEYVEDRFSRISTIETISMESDSHETTA